MILIQVRTADLKIDRDLLRSSSSKTFEERLRSSIEEMGLAEPIKVSKNENGEMVVVDGVLRLRAVRSIRESDPSRFEKIPAYLVEHALRYEIRYQSDVYQDLLPSQLASLVEHLHRAEGIRKMDIARYIGVSPATLRNYTGLWRLLERGGRFSDVVQLMDVGVLPASNPYAWLRLTDQGLDSAIRVGFATGRDPKDWIAVTIVAARAGTATRFPLKHVETVTSSLPASSYRVAEDVRDAKRSHGLQKSRTRTSDSDLKDARNHLSKVAKGSGSPVLVSAAMSLREFLK
jgi:hypothetical protein